LGVLYGRSSSPARLRRVRLPASLGAWAAKRPTRTPNASLIEIYNRARTNGATHVSGASRTADAIAMPDR